MKKSLLAIVGAALMAMTGNATVVKSAAVGHQPMSAPMASRANQVFNLTQNVVSFYDSKSYTTPNYYIVLSDDPNATYDANNGLITNIYNGYCLFLDLYNVETNPVAVPAGVYYPTEAASPAPGTYTTEYSYFAFYDGSGQQAASIKLDGDVNIDLDENGVYTVVAKVTQDGTTLDLRYEGRLGMSNTHDKPTVYPQLKKDVNVKMTGGVAFYQGVSDVSGQGATYLNLYSGKFDPETGAMTEPGSTIAMLIGHKKFMKKESYTLVPGTYEVSYTVNRFTWYPAREVDYSGMTMVFGSYYREMAYNVDQTKDYKYGYLKTGVLEIEEAEGGNFKATLRAKTDLGYEVDVDFEGPVTMQWANIPGSASVSNLTDDVALDLDKIKKARVWHTNIIGGCRSFILDIGSPAGRDEEINFGGDLFRMEIFTDIHESTIPEGTYTVVERRWNDNELRAGGKYQPFQLNKGHFTEMGGSTGTRYTHFKEGSYCVEDLHGPAEEGTIGIKIEENGDYTFTINIMDDAGWYITGGWSGPLDLQYDPEALAASVREISADNSNSLTAWVDGTKLRVGGAEGALSLIDLTGKTIACGTAAEGIDIEGVESGIYIIKNNNKAIKIVL